MLPLNRSRFPPPLEPSPLTSSDFGAKPSFFAPFALEQGGRGYGDSAALRGLRAFGAEGDDLYAHPAFGTSADDSLIRLDEFEFIA